MPLRLLCRVIFYVSPTSSTGEISRDFLADHLGDDIFLADSAAIVSLSASGRDYLIINNDIDGYSRLSDAVIEITGYSGNLDDFMII